MDNKIETLVEMLGCSIQEAEQIIREDELINSGADLFELTKEQKENVKKVKKGDSKPREKSNERKRKTDNDKIDLLGALVSGVEDMATSLEITNKEREFVLVYNGAKYKVVLSKPRN